MGRMYSSRGSFLPSARLPHCRHLESLDCEPSAIPHLVEQERDVNKNKLDTPQFRIKLRVFRRKKRRCGSAPSYSESRTWAGACPACFAMYRSQQHAMLQLLGHAGPPHAPISHPAEKVKGLQACILLQYQSNGIFYNRHVPGPSNGPCDAVQRLVRTSCSTNTSWHDGEDCSDGHL